MSRGNRGSANARFANGKKIRSIYSPGYVGTRVPDGKPGNQRPLLGPEYLEDLYALRRPVRPEPVYDPETGEEWVG